MRLAQQRHQPLDDRRAAIGEMDGAELGDGSTKFPGHSLSPNIQPNPYTGAKFAHRG
jgi:hypothetical protein